MLPAGQLRLRAGLGATGWLDGDQLDRSRRAPFPPPSVPGQRRPDRPDHRLVPMALLAGSATPISPSMQQFPISGLTGPSTAWPSRSTAAGDWLRFTAAQQCEELAGYPELLAAPTTTTPNVRYFDPVTGNRSTSR